MKTTVQIDVDVEAMYLAMRSSEHRHIKPEEAVEMAVMVRLLGKYGAWLCPDALSGTIEASDVRWADPEHGAFWPSDHLSRMASAFDERAGKQDEMARERRRVMAAE